jgi:hypothetical protein
MTKYCVSCKFYNIGICEYRFPNTQVDVVSGVVQPQQQPWQLATTLRSWGWLFTRIFNVCGAEGQFWEQRP